MKKKIEKRPALFIGAAFLLAWFGALLALFPVGNPFENALESVGGSGGREIAAVAGGLAVGIGVLIVVGFTISRALAEIGVDAKQLCKDEFLILIGRKVRPSEHHVDEYDE